MKGWDWIPAPRLRGGKLRGDDRCGAEGILLEPDPAQRRTGMTGKVLGD